MGGHENGGLSVNDAVQMMSLTGLIGSVFILMGSILYAVRDVQ